MWNAAQLQMVQEGKIAKQLQEQGVDIDSGELDKPLLYDLYAVDEHRGGLGGGHYRAYAFNDVTRQWYQFDDAFVSLSRPEAAVVSPVPNLIPSILLI